MSEIKKIPWWKPQMGSKELEYLQDVLRNHFPNEGKWTENFQKRIAELLGCSYAVAVTSGTAAMFLCLKALNIGPGDEVIVPDMTFIATANAVEMTGAKPVLVDVHPKTLSVSVEAIERAITSRTKALLPVHVSGRPAEMSSILEIGKKKNLFVVEDAAEAFMSMHKGKYLGTYGIAGCFSLSPHKTISTGQGGIIVTKDEKLHRRLVELKDQGRPVRGTGGDDLHNVVGYNFKFTDLQAAVGMGQLEYLFERMESMKKIQKIYKEELKNLPGLSLLPFDLEDGELPQWTDVLVENRDAFDSYLKSQGIDCRRFWFPLHTQKPYLLPHDSFPNSTSLSPHALWLPSAFTLSEEDVHYVCSHIRKFLTK